MSSQCNIQKIEAFAMNLWGKWRVSFENMAKITGFRYGNPEPPFSNKTKQRVEVLEMYSSGLKVAKGLKLLRMYG